MATQNFTAIPGAAGIYTDSGLTLTIANSARHTFTNVSGASVEVIIALTLPDVTESGIILKGGESFEFKLRTDEEVYVRILSGFDATGADCVIDTKTLI